MNETSDLTVRAGDAVRRMQGWAQEHGDWRTQNCINLVAANNAISPSVRAALSSPLAEKPISGSLGRRHHMGGRYVDKIESTFVELARELFHATAIDYRPVTGSLANSVATHATLRPGDTVFLLPLGAPCHRTHTVYAGYVGARIVRMPFDYHELDVDLDALRKLALAERPKMIVLGTALMLFPYRLRDVRAIADEVGALVLYDAAHPLGLIAGGQFQNPLEEGAHLMTGSTQKTMPGPIGGLVLTRDERLGEAVANASADLLSNYHNNRVLGLGIALAEMLAFGRPYAAACLANARTLAEGLAGEGFAVLGTHKGFTRSNKVVLRVDGESGSQPLARAFEAANITTTFVTVPSATAGAGRPADGIRIGVQEMTRRGMGAEEMRAIARLMARVAHGEAPEKVGRDAAELASGFRQVRYCFELP